MEAGTSDLRICGEQVRAGADAIQVFDSWVGCLSVEDYRRYVLPRTTELVRNLQETGVPVIYFGTDSATLLGSMQETGAEVIGLDWRIPLDDRLAELGFQRRRAGQSRSGFAVRGLEGNEVASGRHFAPRWRTARAHFSIWGTAFCRKLRWRT